MSVSKIIPLLFTAELAVPSVYLYDNCYVPVQAPAAQDSLPKEF